MRQQQGEQQQQQQQQQHGMRRRRRAVGLEAGFGQLVLPVAAVALCSMTNAFVPQPSWRHAAVGPSPPPATSSLTLPESSAQRGAAAAVRGSRMVLGESPSAACRRALQRAWQASSEEATSHEHLEVQQHQDTTATSAAAAAAAAAGVAMDAGEDSVERGMDFRLTTFNLLAPCYKRMHSEVAPVAAIGEAGTGLLANRARAGRTARESEFDDVWRERALETVEFIRGDMWSSDIICLQEFWLEPSYHAIFRSALSKDYDFHTVKRTGGKADGVAVLLRRGKFDVRSKLGLSLSPVGDRVALVMHLRSLVGGEAGGAGAQAGEDLILVNTHLAFPHNALDRVNQMSQIEVVTRTVEGVIGEAGLPPMTPRVVVGDLNVEETDPVCRHLGKNGFRSAFASLHRERRVITHRNHRGEEVMVDHVFVKAPGFAGRRRGDSVAPAAAPEIPGLVPRLHEDVSVEEALLLPKLVDADEWSPHFSLSDHRPLTVRLKFPAE